MKGKEVWRLGIVRLLIVTAMALLLAVNLKSFVRAGHLVPGGISGLTLLTQRIAARYWSISVPYAPIYLMFNAVPIAISLRHLGKKFTLYSIVMIVLNSIFTDMMPDITITYELPLISIFGGIINGVVISMCLLANATSGGTDFIAVYLSVKKNVDAFNYILAFNVVTLSISGLLFGWDTALYSIIFQFTSTQVVGVLYRRYHQDTLLIITDKPKELVEAINRATHHGATLFKGEGCFEQKERNLVYCVVSGDEVKKVRTLIRELDDHAFVNVIRTEQMSGRFYHPPSE